MGQYILHIVVFSYFTGSTVASAAQSVTNKIKQNEQFFMQAVS